MIATTSLRPMLTDLGLASFDSELRVPPITHLRALDHVLKAVDLFPTREERKRAIQMLQQAGLGDSDGLGDVDGYGGEGAGVGGRLNIGIKKLLSVVEMARQEPEAVAERLTSALMGLGM